MGDDAGNWNLGLGPGHQDILHTDDPRTGHKLPACMHCRPSFAQQSLKDVGAISRPLDRINILWRSSNTSHLSFSPRDYSLRLKLAKILRLTQGLHNQKTARRPMSLEPFSNNVRYQLEHIVFLPRSLRDVVHQPRHIRDFGTTGFQTS